VRAGGGISTRRQDRHDQKLKRDKSGGPARATSGLARKGDIRRGSPTTAAVAPECSQSKTTENSASGQGSSSTRAKGRPRTGTAVRSTPPAITSTNVETRPRQGEGLHVSTKKGVRKRTTMDVTTPMARAAAPGFPAGRQGLLRMRETQRDVNVVKVGRWCSRSAPAEPKKGTHRGVTSWRRAEVRVRLQPRAQTASRCSR